MSGSTLTDFLLARIAEDEERDLHLLDCPYVRWGGVDNCECGQGSRLRAEREAKQRIVKLHEADEWGLWCLGCSSEPDPCPTLRYLTLPYADHKDYREEWKP